MSNIFKKGPADVHANITPMIDVAFLLIVFFVVVSQIVQVETVPMDLPTPDEPASQPPQDEQRTIINIVPAGDGSIEAYRIGSTTFAPDSNGIEQLKNHLTNLYAANPRLRLNLRADRATQYRFVQPVFDAVQQAASLVSAEITPRVNLVIVRENQR